MRLPRAQTNAGAYGFVEDWGTEGASCLDNKPRAAYFGNVKYLDHSSGTWVNVTKARGTAFIRQTIMKSVVITRMWSKAIALNSATGGNSVGYPLNMPSSATSTPMTLP